MDANRASNNELSSTNELTRNGTTSALTRDAARLRSVMVQAAERGENGLGFEEHARPEGDGAIDEEHARNDARNRGDLARTAAMPSLPDLADEQIAVPSQKDQRIETTSPQEPAPVPAGSRRPTSLRTPSVAGRAERTSIAARSGASGGATMLQPVEQLRSESAMKNRSAIPAAEKQVARSTTIASPASDAAHADRDRPSLDPHAAAPVYTEIERKGSYSYGVEEKPAPQGERIGVDAPSHHIATEGPRLYSRPTRRRGAGIGRKVVAGVTVLVGTAIGIGLYAGGGDLLSNLFSNENEGVAVISPSTVTERPVDAPAPGSVAPGGIAPGDVALNDVAEGTSGTEGVVPGSAPSGAAPSLDGQPASPAVPAPAAGTQPSARPSAQSTTQPSAARAASSRPEPTVVDAEDREPSEPTGRTQRRETPSSASAATSPTRASGNAKGGTSVDPKGKSNDKAATEKGKEPVSKVNKYLVQVRATPDEAEAKLIARRLRGKGASNVAIVPQKGKDGTTIYRVRYNTTGTITEAQSAASRAGYKNVWVVKQNK